MDQFVLDQIAENVQIADGCWEWKGVHNDAGYSIIRLAFGRRAARGRVHRILYELLIGEIPEGTELDHLCRNRGCVRPDHVEPVDHATNMARARGHRLLKTHCPQGHPYEGDNLYIRADGARVCKTCWYGRIRAWKQRQKG